MLTIRSILHPTDFSDHSKTAFLLACDLARHYHAPLHVLHVSTGFEAFKGELLSDENAQQYLTKDKEKLEAVQCPDVDIHRHLVEGAPAEQILALARSLPCDVIVMGTHGRSGWKRLALGSVTEQVLREASCPVISVKTPAAR